MFSLLGFGIYVILWWVAFFMVLPIGAHSAAETERPHVDGAEQGAPVRHNLGAKALWAAGIAAALWVGVYVAARNNVFAIGA